MMIHNCILDVNCMKKKKTMALFSIIASVFTGGCIETFEVIDLKNSDMESFLNSHDINALEVEQYRFCDILISAYFTQCPSGGYDLRLSVWAPTKDEKVTVKNASVSPLEMTSDLEIEVVADQRHSESGLFLGNKVIISQISGESLFEYGSKGGTINVSVSAERNEEVKSFSYSFTATKKRVAAPIH